MNKYVYAIHTIMMLLIHFNCKLWLPVAAFTNMV